MAALAAVSLSFATLSFAFHTGHMAQPIFAHLLIVALALVILPSTVSLELSDYFGAKKCVRWMFVAVKVALVVIVVLCVFMILVTFGLGPLAPHVLLAGYMLGFRWALIDQRARCPVCLHLLRNPIRIGQPSQTFLGWYGTESICTKGHGLLHVPEFTRVVMAPKPGVPSTPLGAGSFRKGATYLAGRYPVHVSIVLTP